jgi:hypothetical protein
MPECVKNEVRLMKLDSCKSVGSCKLDKNRVEVYFVLFKEALS